MRWRWLITVRQIRHQILRQIDPAHRRRSTKAGPRDPKQENRTQKNRAKRAWTKKAIYKESASRTGRGYKPS